MIISPGTSIVFMVRSITGIFTFQLATILAHEVGTHGMMMIADDDGAAADAHLLQVLNVRGVTEGLGHCSMWPWLMLASLALLISKHE